MKHVLGVKGFRTEFDERKIKIFIYDDESGKVSTEISEDVLY